MNELETVESLRMRIAELEEENAHFKQEHRKMRKRPEAPLYVKGVLDTSQSMLEKISYIVRKNVFPPSPVMAKRFVGQHESKIYPWKQKRGEVLETEQCFRMIDMNDEEYVFFCSAMNAVIKTLYNLRQNYQDNFERKEQEDDNGLQS